MNEEKGEIKCTNFRDRYLNEIKNHIGNFSALLSILTEYALYQNCISSFLGISTYHILSYD